MSYRRRRPYRRDYRQFYRRENNYVPRSVPSEKTDWFEDYVRPVLRVAVPAINAIGTSFGIPGTGTALQTVAEGAHGWFDSDERDSDTRDSESERNISALDSYIPFDDYEEYDE